MNFYYFQKQRDKISPKEVIQFGKDDMFKITIEKTREGQKRTSPIANLSSGQKVEKKRSATDNSEPQTWGDFFRQQTLWYMSKKPCTCKCNEEREIKKNINVGKQQKSPVKSIPVSIINYMYFKFSLTYEYMLVFLFKYFLYLICC